MGLKDKCEEAFLHAAIRKLNLRDRLFCLDNEFPGQYKVNVGTVHLTVEELHALDEVQDG